MVPIATLAEHHREARQANVSGGCRVVRATEVGGFHVRRASATVVANVLEGVGEPLINLGGASEVPERQCFGQSCPHDRHAGMASTRSRHDVALEPEKPQLQVSAACRLGVGFPNGDELERSLEARGRAKPRCGSQTLHRRLRRVARGGERRRRHLPDGHGPVPRALQLERGGCRQERQRHLSQHGVACQ